MSLTTEVQNLTNSTTALLAAVQASKGLLDGAVDLINTEVVATKKTAINPSAFQAVSDDALLSAALDYAQAGQVIDLAGRSYVLSSTKSISKKLTLQNGSITIDGARALTLAAEEITLKNLQVTRTGAASASLGAVTVAAAKCVLENCRVISSASEALRIGNGLGNELRVKGGYYESQDPNDSFAILLLSGATHNYDVVVDGAKIRNSGKGTGVGFYNCSRSAVKNCDVRNIRASDWFVPASWELVSGTVYRTLDRTDCESNAIWYGSDGVSFASELIKNTPSDTTAPSVGFYTVVSGYLYVNTGAVMSPGLLRTRRTNGYGILMYATTSEDLGMRDNLIAHNYVEDTDGFGIYYQTLENVPKNNRTLQNTLRDVCKMGIAVSALPFAGIGVFGGIDVKLEGDTIEGVGTPTYPCPGVDFKATTGTPLVKAHLSNVTVRGATASSIQICPGVWTLSGCRVEGGGLQSADSGFGHKGVTTGDIIDATLIDCASTDNTGSGARFETSTSAQLRIAVIGGKWMRNTNRGVSFTGARDVVIDGAPIFDANGVSAINMSGTNQRVQLLSCRLRSGVGITIAAGIADLTVGSIVHDGSSGTKVSISGPYKVSGRGAGYVTEWVGPGSPEGAVTAAVGSTYRRSDGSAATSFYVKETGTGNTGWVAK